VRQWLKVETQVQREVTLDARGQRETKPTVGRGPVPAAAHRANLLPTAVEGASPGQMVPAVDRAARRTAPRPQPPRMGANVVSGAGPVETLNRLAPATTLLELYNGRAVPNSPHLGKRKMIQFADSTIASESSHDLKSRYGCAQVEAAHVDSREYRLFLSLDVDGSGSISVDSLKDALATAGIDKGDARLAEAMQRLSEYTRGQAISFAEFSEAVRPNILLIERALQGNLVVPDFDEFCSEIARIYTETKANRGGNLADYIPQLANVDPDLFGAAVCTVDGQRFSVGDTAEDFSVQSCSKPITYCLALEEHGVDKVHQHVGREPSGRLYNELALGDDGKPHNPMINAGAIMCSSLVKPQSDKGTRFDFVLDRWTALCGGQKARFNNAIYQSERQTADRNFALGYFMKEHGAFPEGTDLLETLDFYFQNCAIEANADMMSVLAGTLANGGVCPATGERIFARENVRHCLSLMCSCGMYDFSGEFAFVVGLPAKSGVSGAIMLVIPNVLGLCIWSPRLDKHGNSVRGIEFCKSLVNTFSVHNFDNLTLETDKFDPRANRVQVTAEKVGEMIWASSKGDLGALQSLIARGCDPNEADYDRRTPIHLAAAEGRTQVVRYFIEYEAEINPRDRWGGTPLDDARRHGHTQVAELLERLGGVGGETEFNESPMGAETSFDQPSGEVSNQIIESIYAASQGNLSVLRRLVARGIDLSAADYDLRTPLHLAAAEGHEHVVQFFIDHGFDLSPRDRWGNTPLDDAQRHGHVQVVELLSAAS